MLAAIEGTALAYSENATVTITTAITINDVDNATLSSATVQITGNLASGEDVLSFTNVPATMGNIAGAYSAGTGTMALVSAGATATLPEWQAALRAVRYLNTSDNPSTLSRTVTFSVNDGATGSNTQARNITVTAVNDAPVLANIEAGPLTFTEGSAATAITGSITVTDADHITLANGTVAFAAGFAPGEDVLDFTGSAATGNITRAFNPGSGVLGLTSAGATATLTQWQAALRAVTYFNNSVSPSTAARTITFTVSDGTAASNTQTRTINVTAVNNPPVLSNINGNVLGYVPGSGARVLTLTGVVTDVDSANLIGGTVQITGNYQSAEDVLGPTGALGGTGVLAAFNSANGTLTLAGSATPANYQAALRMVTYTNSAGAPNTGMRTITFKVNDGTDNSVPALIDIVFNQSPVLANIEAGALAYTEQAAATAITATITVADADSPTLASGTVSIGSSSPQETLGFTNVPATMGNIAGSYSSGTGILTLTSAGSSATLLQWQAALRAVTYVSTSDSPPATRTISFTLNDGVANGNTVTRTINITAVNDAPVLSGIESTALAYTENATVQITSTLVVTDDSAGLASATVSITAGGPALAQDTLGFTNVPATMGNIGGSFSTGTLTLSSAGATATPAQWQAALRAVTYTNTSDAPNTSTRTVAFQINDGALGSNIVTRIINVTAVNDAPILATIEAGALSYTENGAAAPITASLLVNDPDTATLASGTVAITANFQLGADVLGFTNVPATMGNIAGSYAAATGVLTLTSAGATATLAQWQVALRAVTYSNSSDNPSTAARTIAFQVNDGALSSNTQSRNINVTAVNDAPVAVAGGTYTATTNIQITVPAASGLLVSSTDVDSAAATLTMDTTAINVTAGATVTLNADGSFVFNPAPGVTGAQTFQYRVQDTGSPAPGVFSAYTTVTVTVSGPVIWFTDAAAAAGGNGTLAKPFNTLAAANTAANASTHSIFLYSGNYTGGITLTNGVGLFGQGATGTFDTVLGITPPTGSLARPTLGGTAPVITTTVASTNAVNISALNNTIRGLTIGNTTGTKIASGASFGTLTVSEVTLNGAGQALDLTSGTLAANFLSITSTSGTRGISLSAVSGMMSVGLNGTTISGSTLQGILVTGSTANIGFGNTSVTGGTNQISLQNNSAGLRSFGTVDLSNSITPAQPAFLHSSGGGLTATGAMTITNPSGTGIDIQSSTTQISFGATRVLKGGTAGIGVNLGGAATGNSGTVTFDSLDITTSNGTALLALNNTGTITVTNATAGISAAGGPAVSITGTSTGARTPLSANLLSLSTSSSGTTGLNLVNVSGTFAGGTGTLTGTTGAGVNIAGSTANITYNGSVTKTTSGNTIAVDTQSAGTVTLGGAINANTSAAGINLTNNTGGTINFTGAITLTTTTNAAFTATGGGTISSTNTTSALTTTTGAGLNVANTTIGAGGLTFASVSTNGAANGIVLDTVGAGNATINGGSIVGATSRGIRINSGTGNVTYSGSITTSGAAARSVEVTNHTGGTVALSGAVTDTSLGIDLAGNTGATINFTGNIQASTGANTAFSAIGGGTISATNTASVLTTTTGTALNVANTTIGAGGLKFLKISANGAANGIVLNTTGATGGLMVTGDGTNNASGGLIQNCTNNGISLTSTQNVSLTSMSIQSSTHSGINGTTVTNFSFINGTINNSGNTAFESNIAFNTSPTTADNISGTLTITGSTLTNAFYSGLDVQAGNGTVTNANISNNTITSSTNVATSVGFGVNFNGVGTSSTRFQMNKATINNNVISNFPTASGIQINGGNADPGGPGATIGIPNDVNNLISITGNQIKGSSTGIRMGGSAIIVAVQGANPASRSQANFNISNNGTGANPLTNIAGTVLGVGCNGHTTMTATTNNNVIVANQQANLGGANGIAGGGGIGGGGTAWTPNLTWIVTGNNISQTDGNGILIVNRATNGSVALKITGNTLTTPINTGGTARQCIRVDSGNNTAGENTNVYLNISGNTCQIGSNGAAGIGVRKQGTVANVDTFGITGLSPSPATGAQAATFVAGQNPNGNGCDAISGSNFVSTTLAPPLIYAEGGIEAADRATINKVALTQAQLDGLVSAARAQWEATGLTDAQRALLETVRFEVADLGLWRLGEAGKGVIRVDAMAGGAGWYFEGMKNEKCKMKNEMPLSENDVQFCKRVSETRFYTTPEKDAAGRIDLLTTIMHEMGHAMGLPDRYEAEARESIMYGYLTKGERRVPARGDASQRTEDRSQRTEVRGQGSETASEEKSAPRVKGMETLPCGRGSSGQENSAHVQLLQRDFSIGSAAVWVLALAALGSAGFWMRRRGVALIALLLLQGAVLQGSAQAADTVTVDVPVLPAGKQIVILFDATVAKPVSPGTSVVVQGSITGANFAVVLSDDPATPAANDATVIALENSAPALTSAISALPNPALPGQNVQFTAVATDDDLDAFTFTWDFKDGSISLAQNPGHIFAAPGTYMVALTLVDGRGGVTVASVPVVVQGPPGDADNDKFIDEIETALGSDPLSDTSRPFDLASPTATNAFLIPNLKIALDFGKPNKDSMALTGMLPLGASTAPKQVLITDVGGVVKAFNVDAKGRAKSGNDKLSISVSKGSVANKANKKNFNLKVSKGSFAAALADEQLTQNSTSGPRTVKVTVIYANTVFTATVAQDYSVKKTIGKTKMPK